MDIVLTILRISRPRFWLYTAGPYLIGSTIAGVSFFSLEFLYGLFFFLIPANIIIYGLNDLADHDTDRFNAKKKGYELPAQKSTRGIYIFALVASGFCIVPLLFSIGSIISLFFLSLFFVFSVAYSVKPVRLKARPFLDSASNILYVLPGFFAYYVFAPSPVPLSSTAALLILCSSWAWCFAMHLYSAIPDISADEHANLRTTAVVLGRNKSILVCALMWIVSGLLLLPCSMALSGVIILIYGGLCMITYRSDESVVYRIFPFVNSLVGALIFVFVLIP